MHVEHFFAYLPVPLIENFIFLQQFSGDNLGHDSALTSWTMEKAFSCHGDHEVESSRRNLAHIDLREGNPHQQLQCNHRGCYKDKKNKGVLVDRIKKKMHDGNTYPRGQSIGLSPAVKFNKL